MRKSILVGIIVLAAAAAAYFLFTKREQPAAAADQAQAGAPAGRGAAGRPMGGGGFGGGGFGGGFRPPMTVEVAKVSRGSISSYISVVGNLIGEATVDVAPKTGGRLQSMHVKLGDRVRRGQLIAKIEDREIVEQVRQAEASHQVAEATIRQREADLNLAETNAERSRNLYARQLLPKQTLDDSEARFSAALAQLDLARAQLAQSEARLQELRINLANTNVVSPIDGFVSQRNLDSGAWVSQNAPVASVVDISSLRLVANVVERDLRAVTVGDPAVVEVDAFPGEQFKGRIARLSPILDPATRTAAMEIEIPNRDYRLKPGMYAKVALQVESRTDTLVVPKVALVDVEGQRGVYLPTEDNRAQFRPVKIGLEDTDQAEILDGLQEGDVIVSTGAGALRRNDQLAIAGQEGARGPRGGNATGPGGPGGRPGMGGGRGPGPSAAPGEGGEPGARRRSGGAEGSGGQTPGGQDAPRRPESSRQSGQQRPMA